MTLEGVWEVLENGRWESKQALREASGVDDNTLSRIINFLDRWDFVEIQRTPDLLVRRRPGAISPVETFNLLRSINGGLSVPSRHRRLAERVACRVCGGRNLTLVNANEVECVRCHEKQWFALEIGEPLTDRESAQVPERPGLLRRIFVRLGFPQEAFRRYIPKPVRYFWFRCTSCGRISTDYPHGYSRYLTCPSCECHNYYW